MIDPQKVPYIACIGPTGDKTYHIYDSPEGNARCGEKPASFQDTMNRTWRPTLNHLIEMDGHQEIHDRIYPVTKINPYNSGPIPICKTCSATAQSDSPLWHKVLQLHFEKSPDSLIQSGHDVRLIQMPKGALIGWVEHVQKPKYVERDASTVSGGSHRSRYGAWRSSGYNIPAFSGWMKTKIWNATMYVSKDNHETLVRELLARVKNTTADEANMYLFPSEDIYFMAQFTDGKYKYAGGWTFSKPTFQVKQMEYDEFISAGYWMPVSHDLADDEIKTCPGCGEGCALERVPLTSLQNHRCLMCKWSTVQPQKPSLVPKE